MPVNFTPFPLLQTTRMTLRQLTPADVEEVFILRSDERVLRHIARVPITQKDEALAFIERITKFAADNVSVLWGMELKEQPGKIVGTICFWNLQPENYRTEIGYNLLPDHWGKGYAREAIEAVMDYGFNTMQLHSVEARVNATNIASAKTLEATGFIKEGYLKEEMFFNEKFLDSIIYSRLNK